MSLKIGIYPGSFDPFTCGHLDILRRAAALLDVVIVAVLTNTSKSPFFSFEERVDFIKAAVAEDGLTNVKIDQFHGLLVDFARSKNARYLVRGLRAVMDFEYEFQIGAMNRKLAPEIETLHFMAAPEYAFISSSVVREVAMLGGAIDGLVPEINKSRTIERLAMS